jgi:glycosyltransferase involved in cell wall biosynthesis
MKLISVIIPTYNRDKVILRAIESVLKQTYLNFEIIIIDDGSTDKTELLLNNLVSKNQIQYYKTENLGVSHARNLGVSKSSGDWIAFLDSDDEWLPHKLQTQIEYLETNPHLQIVYGQEIWMRNGLRVNQKKIHQKYGGWIFDKCIQQCFIAPSSTMLTKNLFIEMGQFDLDFLVCEDYDLWLKISSKFEIGFIEKPIIIKYGGDEDQLSTQFKAMDYWRIKALVNILKTRSLPQDDRQKVIKFIIEKSQHLLLGFQKHGHISKADEMEQLLKLYT